MSKNWEQFKQKNLKIKQVKKNNNNITVIIIYVHRRQKQIHMP